MVESVAKHLDVNGVLGTVVLMIWKIHGKYSKYLDLVGHMYNVGRTVWDT